jgi:hypothetical protein
MQPKRNLRTKYSKKVGLDNKLPIKDKLMQIVGIKVFF